MYLSADNAISIARHNTPESFVIELARPVDSPQFEKLGYTYQEAAKVLSVSESTIKRQVSCGKLDAISIGRSRRVTAASIKRLLQGNGGEPQASSSETKFLSN